MKTSVLISSITAICLLATFAVTPRRHGEDKMNLASTTEISFVAEKKATMLPGVVITPGRKMEAGVAIPVIPSEDFSYLKFDVTDYMESDDLTLADARQLPEATDADLSYLKFRVGDYSTGSEFSVEEMEELPVNEFGYLRFDVNDYINNTGSENEGIGELPQTEAGSVEADIAISSEVTPELNYLKFDVNKYYNAGNLSADEVFELPEE